jgi:hypothetical protein
METKTDNQEFRDRMSLVHARQGWEHPVDFVARTAELWAQLSRAHAEIDLDLGGDRPQMMEKFRNAMARVALLAAGTESGCHDGSTFDLRRQAAQKIVEAFEAGPPKQAGEQENEMTSFRMQNDSTGEISPAHRIGETENGEPIYQGVEGWTLQGANGQDVDADIDGDGNWVVPKEHPLRI